MPYATYFETLFYKPEWSGIHSLYHLRPPGYSLCPLNPNAYRLIINACGASLKNKMNSSSATRMYELRQPHSKQFYNSRSFAFPFNPDPSVSILNRGVPAGLASLPSPWKNSHENLSALPVSFQTTTSSPE